MSANSTYPLPDKLVLEVDQLQRLLDLLIGQEHTVYGPTVRQQAVVIDEITSTRQLPLGWSDEQDGGRYRLIKSDRSACFDFVVGPQSWKKILYPPLNTVWSAQKAQSGFELQAPPDNGPPKPVLFGVRPCELAAIGIQDRILSGGDFEDPGYRRLRDRALIIAVNCVRPGGTCFCASVGTGPQAKEGFDLSLTEIFEPEGHQFVIEIGSAGGEQLAAALATKRASSEQMAASAKALQQAASAMGRRLDVTQLKERLYAKFDDPHWEEIASRCLTCGNCTLVCPTCFCVNIEDSTDLTGTTAERRRCWDSCYSVSFSYIHGGSIRTSSKARYRQWLMHKLAYWQDQFQVLGCVGCGRCITWCPVGIDITEESGVLTAQQK